MWLESSAWYVIGKNGTSCGVADRGPRGTGVDDGERTSWAAIAGTPQGEGPPFTA